MKINRITLFNVGPYYGKNVFNIDNSKNKNIVLIGGKNGSGKTTFFDSIRTCLYGHKAFGFETTSSYYLNQVSKLINDLIRGKDNQKSYVELELLLDDGMDNNIYLLKRQWQWENSKMLESFSVALNGKELSDIEITDFNDYLMHLIPPSLFKYYFFDGEKIAEFFLKKYSDDSFKNAFLTMTGYDNIQIMLKNFKRNAISNKLSESKSSKYFEELDKKQKNDKQINSLREKIILAKDKITYLNNEIKQLENRFKNSGGISKKKVDEINKKILFEENSREQMHKIRKELCNTEVPYFILKDKISCLLKQMSIEQSHISSAKISEILTTRNIIESMSSLHLNTTDKQNIAKTISGYFNTLVSKSDNKLLNLSDSDYAELRLLIESHKKFNPDSMINLYYDIKKSLKSSQELKNYLINSSQENYESFVINKSKMEHEISAIQTEISTTEILLNSLLETAILQEKYFQKAKEEYEEELKMNSVNDISSRALLALEESSKILLRSQINKIEEKFPQVFNCLINKKDLVSGIYIDDQLNIFPFRNVPSTKEECEKFIIDNISSSDYVIRRSIESVKNQLKNLNNDFCIPTEIVSPFSQGEKQIYIMAIYYSLMTLSKISIPFIIDTPFARIDTEHRKNILQNFFNKLKGQSFILSTDEEIIGNYKKIIETKISNEFLLKYQSRGKTKVFENKYFEEER